MVMKMSKPMESLMLHYLQQGTLETFVKRKLFEVNDLLNFTHFKESGKAGLKV